MALNCQISFSDLEMLIIVFFVFGGFWGFFVSCLLMFLLTLYFFRVVAAEPREPQSPRAPRPGRLQQRCGVGRPGGASLQRTEVITGRAERQGARSAQIYSPAVGRGDRDVLFAQTGTRSEEEGVVAPGQGVRKEEIVVSKPGMRSPEGGCSLSLQKRKRRGRRRRRKWRRRRRLGTGG